MKKLPFLVVHSIIGYFGTDNWFWSILRLIFDGFDWYVKHHYLSDPFSTATFTHWSVAMIQFMCSHLSIRPGRLTWNLQMNIDHSFRRENDLPNLHYCVPWVYLSQRVQLDELHSRQGNGGLSPCCWRGGPDPQAVDLTWWWEGRDKLLSKAAICKGFPLVRWWWKMVYTVCIYIYIL